MSVSQKLPPVWVMGMTNATFGMFGGFAVITLPQMLAAQGIAGGRIATIIAAVISPAFWTFLLAPVLDVRFSRRTYALVCSLLAALALGVTVSHPGNLKLIEGAMLAGYVAVSLVQGAVGGWMGSLVETTDHSRLGAWFALSNIGASGLMIILGGEALTRLHPRTAGFLLGGLLLLPSLLYVAIPAPGPDRRLASESFSRFFAEIFALLRRREVLIAMLLFLLPAASFTLTNVLGGVGRDFAAGEEMVSVLSGVGAAIAGVVGSLLLPRLAKKLALRPLYLAIGASGALFTLSLLLLPRAPWVFAVAITGENLFQALAFAAGNAITFETIGKNNPLAATQFSFLVAATCLPIVYMGFIDGRAYTWNGIAGGFVVDAGISIIVCLLLGSLLWWLGRSGKSAMRAEVVGPPGFEPGTKAL